MLISSMLVKVIPEKADEIAQLLERIPNVTNYGVHNENNIVIVVESHDKEQLENLCKYIMESYEDVLGVFPTYVGNLES